MEMQMIDRERLFVSTVSLSGTIGYEDTLRLLSDRDIGGIELGYPGTPDLSPTEVPDQYDSRFIAHNYFLPSEDPFILNLSSTDTELRQRSIDYCKRAINFCAVHDIEYYTVHGGFRVDPTIDLQFKGVPTPYERAYNLFLSAIEELGEYALNRGITLGVENNVIAPKHLRDGNNEILMFTHPDEFHRLFEDTNSIGLLLDVGHLRVASSTLGFDPELFGALEDDIVVIHLHSNNGKADQHQPVTPGDWSINFIDRQVQNKTVPIVIESHFESVGECDRFLETIIN